MLITKYKDSKIHLKKSENPPAYFLQIRNAANVIPVDQHGKLLVMHELKSLTNEWIWGFPGGMIERGETASQAARRECEEELGIVCKRIVKITEVKTGFPKTSVTYFLGFGLSKGTAKNWEKIGSIKKMSLQQLYAFALDGKLHDPRMVVAVLALNKKVKQKKLTI